MCIRDSVYTMVEMAKANGVNVYHYLTYLLEKVPNDRTVSYTHLDVYKRQDMCEAYKTDIMRKYKFPVWEGELFAPEQLQSDKLAMLGYKIRWYNDCLLYTSSDS